MADASVVCVDRGISQGMRAGIEAAEGAGVAVEYRTLRAAGQGSGGYYKLKVSGIRKAVLARLKLQ